MKGTVERKEEASKKLEEGIDTNIKEEWVVQAG